MQSDQVLAQLKVYETEDSKLKDLTGKINELVARKEQLQEASLDPLMLKDWAGQMMVSKYVQELSGGVVVIFLATNFID